MPGSIDVTLVSASISLYTSFESEPCDTYAILNCLKEQHRTKNAQDQGRLPVWNETFTFDIQEREMSSELLVQVFNVKSEVDELLGIARIPISEMMGKEQATLCSLVNPVQGEVGKLKAIWKWKPGSQSSLTATGSASKYPHSINTSQPYGKLEAVSDSLAKLSMEKGSGRYSASYPEEDTGNYNKEERTQGGEYYSYPPAASGAYPFAQPPISETCARGGSDYGYPPPGSDTYPPRQEVSHPLPSGAYPPRPDAYSQNNQGYPPYPGSGYPPPQSGAYAPESGAYPRPDAYPPSKESYPPASAYPPSKESYPPYPGSANPPHPDLYKPPGMPTEGFAYVEKGGGDKVKGGSGKEKDKVKGGSGKEKDKGYGSHSPYGQPPPAGYPPSSYPPAPAGYPPYSHPPGGYPPAPQGYPPAPHGYPPAPHGYPQDLHGYPQGYPPQSHGYPPAGYPPQGYPPAHSGPAYPPQGYPASGHGSGGHKPDKHGYAAGSYVGHSSSNSKPSNKHKESKHSSSHKQNKHKKQKSFKGMKFKKFKF